jgi:serine phosphatase RsbU (regulator of sigma subunit)
MAVHYQPARAVGGDFYDFVPLPDGRLMLCVGDVTDKGVPAALIMATTRATLRGAARRMLSPGQALSRVNSLLLPEMPSSMFVTCLYAVLDPQSGVLEFANAGHNLPHWARESGTTEILCRGMPLGLMPDSAYEQRQIAVGPNDLVLMYSDGLTEAHSPHGEMFGIPRLKALVEHHRGSSGELVRGLLAALSDFTGPSWSQEDDVTLLSLQRKPGAPRLAASGSTLSLETQVVGEAWRAA